MTGDCHVRICEGLGVKFPRATRREFHDNSVYSLCIGLDEPYLHTGVPAAGRGARSPSPRGEGGVRGYLNRRQYAVDNKAAGSGGRAHVPEGP